MWSYRHLLCVLALCLPQTLQAASFATYQHDQYSEDLVTAVSQITGAHLSAQPGFAQGEAFGQLFRPNAEDYPIKILGLDLILAGPLSGGATSADIEIWLDAGDGPTPNKAVPDFSINTIDLLNSETGEFDVNLAGNVASRLDFDYDAADSHPPLVYSGNILVMVRYSEPSADLSDAWGNLACSTLIGCGCQPAAPFEDEQLTSGVNILNTYAFGSCEEPNASQWNFSEAVGLSGDFIMRLRAETSGNEDSGNNTGNGNDTTDPTDTNETQTELNIAAVSPGSGANDTATQISVVGNGFVEGTTAALGATALENVSVTGTQLLNATVPAGMQPGSYMLVVINPDETTAFLTDAFEVLEAASEPGDDSAENEEVPESETPAEETPENTDEPEAAPENTDGANQAGSPEAGGCAGAMPTSLWFLLAGLGLFSRTQRRRNQIVL